MFHNKVLKKVIFPITPSLLAATVVTTSDNKEDQEKKVLIRARDLSIYSKPAQESNVKETEEQQSNFLSLVRRVRESVWGVTEQVTEVTSKINKFVETGKAHTLTTIEILRDEENSMQRYGAIAAGGLLGYIIAVRRGWFRRIIYTGTGAAAVAAVCYPEEAKEYSSEGFRLTKRYIVIAYHFVNGVLRDYAGVQLPALPGPLSIGSTSAAEKDPSTVPSSAALMPPPASPPSHISPIPLPSIELPSFVSDSQKKQG